ncbi:MAG: hypothetical protein U0W24_13380 [Bacteroidales bacterium]
MQYNLDVNLFKKNPELFFMKLTQEEEKEFFSFLEYFIYKHDIKLERENIKKYSIEDILPKQVNEFEPLSREEIYAR